jgi:hypothetical protein
MVSFDDEILTVDKAMDLSRGKEDSVNGPVFCK